MKNKAPVIAFDIGGTKIASAIVTSSGYLLDMVREPTRISQGKKAFIDHICLIIKERREYYPEAKSIGIACAGPLDSYGGVLLDPTNFRTKGKTWGLFPIVKELKKRFPKLDFYLENDAAAAILAEKWMGGATHVKNAMILTLGTGLGVGAICNGRLARAGHGLHPDAGLILVNHDDLTAICGSGNYGSAESYLSAGNFEKRVSRILKQPGLQSKDLADRARRGDRKILPFFAEYSEVFAVALYNYATLYSPEVVLLSGSFASAKDLFLPQAMKRLKELLKRRQVGNIDLIPKVIVSPLGNQSCLMGGGYIALHPKNRESPA